MDLISHMYMYMLPHVHVHAHVLVADTRVLIKGRVITSGVVLNTPLCILYIAGAVY